MFIRHSKFSNISYLEKFINSDTLPISGWNINNLNSYYASTIAIIQNNLGLNDYIKYTYPDELSYLKEKIENKLQNKLNVSIFPSATVGNFLLSLILKKSGLNNVLLISPCYYSYLNIYLENNFNVFSEVFTSSDNIKQICINNNIDLIIFTNPLFCESIDIDDHELLSWFDYNNILVIIDSIYGNLNWDKKIPSFIECHKKYLEYNNLIIIESISKKAYLNGIKSAMFFTKKTVLLKEMERIFNYSATPFSVGTIKFLDLYLDNSSHIEQLITKNLEIAKTNFDMISSYLIGTCIKIEPCNQGYWGIAHIDIHEKGVNISSEVFAMKILKKCNIFTIPMNSYFKNYNYSYSFRVNLLNNYDILHQSFSKLIKYFEDIH